VNNNNITNLTIFIDKLVESTPSLKFLSILKNEACPNFFNGHSLKEYNDYRRYVISRLPGLTCLDSTPITNQERTEGDRLYSTISPPTTTVLSPPIAYKVTNVNESTTPDVNMHKQKVKKPRKAKSTTESIVASTTLLPIFPLDSGFSNPHPPSTLIANNVLDEDFDNSSDSSSWSDDNTE